MSEKNIYVRYIEGKHDNNLFIHNAVAVAAALRVTKLLLLQVLLFVMWCAGWQNLLLWSIEFDSGASLLFIQTRLFFMYPLPVLSYLRPRFAYCNTFSVITGMRGAKAGVSPPRRNPPCILCNIQGASRSGQFRPLRSLTSKNGITDVVDGPTF